MTVDISSMTIRELEQLIDDASRRLDQLRVIAETKEQVDMLNARYLDATGRGRGQEWAQPTGAHDAYPQGWTVMHEGKTWESLTPANVWEPGVSGWREQSQESAEGEPSVPEWIQPTGAHDAYKRGDTVVYQGLTWTSAIDANVWAPGVYGWDQAHG